MPLLEVVTAGTIAPDTQTNDRYGRNAGQVAAVTTLAGAALPPTANCTNFGGGKNSSISWQQGLAVIQRTHKSHPGLIAQAHRSLQEVQQATTSMVRTRIGAVSYDSLLKSILLPDEPVQVSLKFKSVNFFASSQPGSKTIAADSFYNGKFLLTNRRLLALSCSPANIGNMTRFGDKNSNGSWNKDTMKYEITHTKSDNISVKSWPLSAVMGSDVMISTRAVAKRMLVSTRSCVCCCGGFRRWGILRAQPVAQVTRKLNIFLENPQWTCAPSFHLEINVGTDVSPNTIYAFVRVLQQLCPAAGALSNGGGDGTGTGGGRA